MNLPPMPEPTLEEVEYEIWGQNARMDCYNSDQMRGYATAAVLAEREACAKVCDDLANQWMQIAASCGGDDAHEVARSYMADELADAIRARGKP